jgi:hypothetical protein
MSVIAVISFALSAIFGVVGVIAAYQGLKSAIIKRGTSRFCAVRQYLSDHVADLVQIAESAQQDLRPDAELPLLTRPGWIPLKPTPLGDVTLCLRETRPDESLDPARHNSSRYWPRRPDGRMDSYSQAIGELAAPKLWFNGPSYRLLEVLSPGADAATGGLRLAFAKGSYFDGIDTAEPLSYELALRHSRELPHVWPGPYRRWLSDAFDLRRRCALPGIDTLTLRVEKTRTTFFLHSRDATEVASMNTTHVVPAGEFQPHSIDAAVWFSDLNIWHTIMREYAEEFLGAPDAAMIQGKTIDFDRDAPYAEFSKALRDGQMKVYLLGIGLEPMTWKPEICTACVWGAASFDRIFGHMLEKNEEGILIVGHRDHGHFQGIEFDRDNVALNARRPEMDPAGRACLTLAWRWRSELGLPVPMP